MRVQPGERPDEHISQHKHEAGHAPLCIVIGAPVPSGRVLWDLQLGASLLKTLVQSCESTRMQ